MTQHGTQFKRSINPKPDSTRWLRGSGAFVNTYREDEAIHSLQDYLLLPFDNVQIYVRRRACCLPLSAVDLHCHIEASRDPSETKSEISCTNSFVTSLIRAE
jgi:hypothetical protein